MNLIIYFSVHSQHDCTVHELQVQHGAANMSSPFFSLLHIPSLPLLSLPHTHSHTYHIFSRRWFLPSTKV